MIDMKGWRPIAEAKKDNTIYDLMVVNSPGNLTDDLVTVTIGSNGFDHTGLDFWQYVGWNWCQDVFRDVNTEDEKAPIPVFFRERPQDDLTDEIRAAAETAHADLNPKWID